MHDILLIADPTYNLHPPHPVLWWPDHLQRADDVSKLCAISRPILSHLWYHVLKLACMWILNRVGDVGHPCNRPLLVLNECDNEEPIVILHMLSLYISCTYFNNRFTNICLYSAFQSILCDTQSYAFSRFMNIDPICLDLSPHISSTCLKVNIWSHTRSTWGRATLFFHMIKTPVNSTFNNPSKEFHKRVHNTKRFFGPTYLNIVI